MPSRKRDVSVRAFVALDLDAVSLRRVARIADRLRMGSGAPSATWTPPGKMHVTLKFMGELSVDRTTPFGKALGALVVDKKAPRPGTFRLDAFPSAEEADVIVAELLDPFGDLRKLAAAVDKIAGKHGCPIEQRPFRPHVTLARLKRAYDTRRWLRPEVAGGTDECAAASMTLYKSDLGAGGSTYTALGRWEYANRS